MAIAGSIQQAVPREPIGLQDGGHVILRCSACNAQLLDVWIQMPQTGQKWRGRALCPYCGDKSYIQEWSGGFAPGGIAIPNPDDPENDWEKTRLVDFSDEKDAEGNDVIVFHVKKVGDGQPVF